MSQTFNNSAEDCQWLCDTALKSYNGIIPKFESFIIDGNEDCPLEIRLFSDKDPKYNDKPIAHFILETSGRYIKVN